MPRTRQGRTGHGTGLCDTDRSTMYRIFADRNRRFVLYHLNQHGSAQVETLVEAIHSWGNAASTGAASPDPDRLRLALHHVHLPLLETSGLVAYDRERGIVELWRVPVDFGEWVDFAMASEYETAQGETDTEGTPDVEGRVDGSTS